MGNPQNTDWLVDGADAIIYIDPRGNGASVYRTKVIKRYAKYVLVEDTAASRATKPIRFTFPKIGRDDVTRAGYCDAYSRRDILLHPDDPRVTEADRATRLANLANTVVSSATTHGQNIGSKDPKTVLAGIGGMIADLTKAHTELLRLIEEAEGTSK